MIASSGSAMNATLKTARFRFVTATTGVYCQHVTATTDVYWQHVTATTGALVGLWKPAVHYHYTTNTSCWN
jgi:hypothetical protein